MYTQSLLAKDFLETVVKVIPFANTYISVFPIGQSFFASGSQFGGYALVSLIIVEPHLTVDLATWFPFCAWKTNMFTVQFVYLIV